MHAKMEFLLSSQIKKFMQDSAVQRVDEEGNIDTLSGIELLEVDTKEKTKWRSRKSLKIGEDCQNFISQLNLSPASLQLKWFFKAVENFHETVAVRYQKYFKTGLESRELLYISALNPKVRKQATTELRLRILSKSYTKVVRNIEPMGGKDTFDSEVEQYVLDDDLEEFRGLDYCDYWEKVRELKEGDWVKYEILPRFAVALGS